jgi:hypothetical protein
MDTTNNNELSGRNRGKRSSNPSSTDRTIPDPSDNPKNTQIANETEKYYQDFMAELSAIVSEEHCIDTFFSPSLTILACEESGKKCQSKKILTDENWTSKDDEYLYLLILKYKHDWKRISRRIMKERNKNYSWSFLKNRYKIFLKNKNQKPKKFTHSEDLLIVKYFEEYGTQWGKIAEHFPNRNPTMIKNRYYSFIKRKHKYEALLAELMEIEKPERENISLENPSSINSYRSHQKNNLESEVSQDAQSEGFNLSKIYEEDRSSKSFGSSEEQDFYTKNLFN